MGHFYRFIRGDRVVIVWGKRAGALGVVVDSAVFQRTLDYLDDFSLPGYHVILADDAVVTVHWDQDTGAQARPDDKIIGLDLVPDGYRSPPRLSRR